MSYEITFGGRFQAGLGITTGKVVVKAGSLYLPATTANVALYPIAGLVVRYQQVPSANYDVGDIAHAGVWPSSLTGLTAATAGVATYARVTSTGSLENTTAPADGDHLMGRINSDGDLIIAYEVYSVIQVSNVDSVLNWISSTPTAPGFAYYMSWDPYTGMFVRIRNAGGANDGEVAISHDYGESFTNIHPASTLAYCNSIGFDNAGNCVVMGPAGSILEGPTTGTLTRRVGVLSPSTIRGYVAYDSVHSKWFVYYEFGGNGYIFQSTDRITWSGNAWPINLYVGCVVCLSPTGTFIVISPDVSFATAQTVRTADGGTTFTSSYNCLPSPVVTAGSLLFSNLLYDTITGNWFVTTWAGTVSKLYRSTDDGVTWAVFIDLPTIAIKRIYSIGTLFLAYAQIAGYPSGVGAWIYAENVGNDSAVEWKLCDFGATPVIETAVAHAPNMIDNALYTYGGFAFLSSTSILWRSLRSGLTGRVVP